MTTTTGKRGSKPKLVPVVPTLTPASSVPFNEALHGLLALTQLLGSLRPTEGEDGGQPTIILTAAGVEMRMCEPISASKNAAAISEAQQEWFHKIEEGLESVRQATEALNAALAKNARTTDQTLATHAAAIESVRAALTQNEQLMESMVELLGPADNFTLPQAEEFSKIS